MAATKQPNTKLKNKEAKKKYIIVLKSNHCIVAGKDIGCHHGLASGPGLTAVEEPEEEAGEEVLEGPAGVVLVKENGDRVIREEEGEREGSQRSPKRQGSSVYDRVRAKLSRSLRSPNSQCHGLVFLNP